ncbi:MAG: DUF433 domain-containing protein [Chitinophagales bacterium]
MLDWKDRISSNPKVLVGKPAIKGTRIGVDLILEKLGAGETIDQLLQSYPHIVKDDIYACLLYAAETIRHESIHAIHS